MTEQYVSPFSIKALHERFKRSSWSPSGGIDGPIPEVYKHYKPAKGNANGAIGKVRLADLGITGANGGMAGTGRGNPVLVKMPETHPSSPTEKMKDSSAFNDIGDNINQQQQTSQPYSIPLPPPQTHSNNNNGSAANRRHSGVALTIPKNPNSDDHLFSAFYDKVLARADHENNNNNSTSKVDRDHHTHHKSTKTKNDGNALKQHNATSGHVMTVEEVSKSPRSKHIDVSSNHNNSPNKSGNDTAFNNSPNSTSRHHQSKPVPYPGGNKSVRSNGGYSVRPDDVCVDVPVHDSLPGYPRSTASTVVNSPGVIGNGGGSGSGPGLKVGAANAKGIKAANSGKVNSDSNSILLPSQVMSAQEAAKIAFPYTFGNGTGSHLSNVSNMNGSKMSGLNMNRSNMNSSATLQQPSVNRSNVMIPRSPGVKSNNISNINPISSPVMMPNVPMMMMTSPSMNSHHSSIPPSHTSHQSNAISNSNMVPSIQSNFQPPMHTARRSSNSGNSIRIPFSDVPLRTLHPSLYTTHGSVDDDAVDQSVIGTPDPYGIAVPQNGQTSAAAMHDSSSASSSGGSSSSSAASGSHSHPHGVTSAFLGSKTSNPVNRRSLNSSKLKSSPAISHNSLKPSLKPLSTNPSLAKSASAKPSSSSNPSASPLSQIMPYLLPVVNFIRHTSRLSVLLAPIDRIADRIPQLLPSIVILELLLLLWIVHQLSLVIEGLMTVVQIICAPVVVLTKLITGTSEPVVKAASQEVNNVASGVADAVGEGIGQVGQGVANAAGGIFKNVVQGAAHGVEDVVGVVDNLGRAAVNGGHHHHNGHYGGCHYCNGGGRGHWF